MKQLLTLELIIDVTINSGQYLADKHLQMRQYGNAMKILVAVKRVIDYNVKIRVKSDGSGVETDHVKMSINPFDEIAVEEAIRLKEKGVANEIIVVSIGEQPCQEVLRHALAMGADRGILILEAQYLEPINIAKILKIIVEKEKIDCVIAGKQAIDDDCNQTPQMLAALLGWPQATFASRISFIENKVLVAREVDEGLQTIAVQLPAVISTDLRLNEPRYIKLPNIMQAKSKKIEVIEAQTLNISLKNHVEVIKVEKPVQRTAGKSVDSIEQLMQGLKETIFS